MVGTLWIVGTPIGNLGDLPPRARDTLAGVDVIAAEDTRRTGRLLQAAGIDPRPALVSSFEGNERDRARELVGRLTRGDDVAVVTDGGMPSVSDPGFRIVLAAIEAGVDVRVVPGPSAALAALVVSGLPTDRFAFEGFPPRRPAERHARLEALRADDRTLVLFESPRRVHALLRDVVDVMGDRRVALARELTKLHEEVLRGRASEVAAVLETRPPKGEVALVIEGAPEEAGDLSAALEEARDLIASGARRREAARVAADHHGVGANAVYEALLS